MFAPSFFDHLEDRINLAVYDTNQEWLMKRRLTEAALINGHMQPIGYEFEDNTEGPHRRTDEHSFKYHPQFEEVGEAAPPFPSPIHFTQLDIAA